ncbi:MAG TPA: ribosome biogenesis GTPase Der [Persephonella sp.]|uniref:GTPase Der n=1 Tax=Persephonella marina (strain DSM 14350 / EX-H1) TaxID=123214 RepID=DER_PERMH|nr:MULTISPECIES: ribosome biogenesis GTPase Der [Persephonella]C0QT02.1 RecName: Full=GTPase Der; AltName: Full=GTP-binding protein EngA [Persephonella marina EX-H1]ACO03928.1 ribosome-associated GTPase EngA [Persephonella marina EX-H1]HCB70564.1 ribosome biogenesis GTPase Der [Persephonella sp.]
MYRVAIVGRPNVGKSSLFNRIIGKRKAIVEDIPGVTRDRIVSTAEWRGVTFEVVDTGGYIESDKDTFAPYIRKQIEKELELSDAFILVVDGKEGLTPADKEIARILHRTDKPVYVAVNKIDNPEMEKAIYEFYELGFEKVFPVSSIQKYGVADLLDAVVQDIPEYEREASKEVGEKEEKSDVIKVAIVGKPNAGKSSLLNAILGEERAVVSEIPGTTRDVVDTLFEWKDQKFLFLDTAGLRKKSKVDYGIEFFSIGRTLDAIKKADVIVHVIDAQQGATEQDTKIAHLIQKYTKPAVIVINKIDTVPPKSEVLNRIKNQVRERLYFIPYAPIVMTSAKNRKGIKQLLKEITDVYNQSWKRVGTGQLNRAIKQILSLRQPPSYHGKPLKIYYATQLEGKPPCFLLFVNHPEGFKEHFLRFLENNLRTVLGFEKAPIKLLLRGKEERRD